MFTGIKFCVCTCKTLCARLKTPYLSYFVFQNLKYWSWNNAKFRQIYNYFTTLYSIYILILWKWFCLSTHNLIIALTNNSYRFGGSWTETSNKLKKNQKKHISIYHNLNQTFEVRVTVLLCCTSLGEKGHEESKAGKWTANGILLVHINLSGPCNLAVKLSLCKEYIKSSCIDLKLSLQGYFA